MDGLLKPLPKNYVEGCSGPALPQAVRSSMHEIRDGDLQDNTQYATDDWIICIRTVTPEVWNMLKRISQGTF